MWGSGQEESEEDLALERCLPQPRGTAQSLALQAHRGAQSTFWEAVPAPQARRDGGCWQAHGGQGLQAASCSALRPFGTAGSAGTLPHININE